MNWAHVHLMINHLPVWGLVIVLGIWLWALWRKDEPLQRTARVVLVLVSLASIAVFLSGEPAEGFLARFSGGSGVASESAIEAHEEAATWGLMVLLVAGVLAAASLPKRIGPKASLLSNFALVTALIAAIVMGWTANLGGKIRHPEVSQPPAAREAVHP